jgi:hypothetical protein
MRSAAAVIVPAIRRLVFKVALGRAVKPLISKLPDQSGFFSHYIPARRISQSFSTGRVAKGDFGHSGEMLFAAAAAFGNFVPGAGDFI